MAHLKSDVGRKIHIDNLFFDMRISSTMRCASKTFTFVLEPLPKTGRGRQFHLRRLTPLRSQGGAPQAPGKGQIIATPHRPHHKWWFSKGILLFQ